MIMSSSHHIYQNISPLYRKITLIIKQKSMQNHPFTFAISLLLLQEHNFSLELSWTHISNTRTHQSHSQTTTNSTYNPINTLNTHSSTQKPLKKREANLPFPQVSFSQGSIQRNCSASIRNSLYKQKLSLSLIKSQNQTNLHKIHNYNLIKKILIF